jgi:hypothetical protein
MDPGFGFCPTCSPISGKNFCDPSTSCISIGSQFYCTCAAGFKPAFHEDGFRLPLPNFEHLVFVTPRLECLELCKEGSLPGLCRDVDERHFCTV